MRATSAWLISVGSNSLNLLFGIGTGVLVARLLGPEGRGQLAEVVYWGGLLLALGICAVPTALTFRIARGESTEHTVPSAVVLAMLLAAASIVMGALVVMSFASDALSSLILAYVLVIIPAGFLGLVLLGIDHGEQRFLRYSLLRLVPQGVYLSGAVVLWLVDAVSVSALLAALCLGSGTVVLLRLIISWRELAKTPRFQELRALARTGLSYHTTALAGIAFQNADRFILIALFTHAELGLYAVALTLSAAGLGIVSAAAATVLFPKLSASRAREVQSGQARNALGATFLLSLGINSAIALSAPLILPLLFGPGFAPAVPLAIVLCLAQVPASMAQVSIVALRAVEDWRAGPYSQLLALAVFAPAALVLGGQFGTLGVALALICGHFASALMLLVRLRSAFSLEITAFLAPEPAWVRSQLARLYA